MDKDMGYRQKQGDIPGQGQRDRDRNRDGKRGIETVL